jgi:hypothetical protein
MTAVQTELELAKPRARNAQGPIIAEEVHQYLVQRGDWATRSHLRQIFNYSPREVRLAGEYSRGRILSGNRGLKAIECATKEDYQETSGRLLAQINNNLARWRETNQQWFRTNQERKERGKA